MNITIDRASAGRRREYQGRFGFGHCRPRSEHCGSLRAECCRMVRHSRRILQLQPELLADLSGFCEQFRLVRPFLLNRKQQIQPGDRWHAARIGDGIQRIAVSRAANRVVRTTRKTEWINSCCAPGCRLLNPDAVSEPCKMPPPTR